MNTYNDYWVSKYLQHYGVPGMKWGVRKDNTQTKTRAHTGRLNLFGKEGHNILYITGISVSGKSTLATKLANKLNAEPIHLDWYYDRIATQNPSPFSKFLKDNGVNINKIHTPDGKLNYKKSDKIFPLLKEYSKDHKLIVEGVQLLDDTISVGISDVLKKEPVISLDTRSKVAFNRSTERDQTINKYLDFVKSKQRQEVLNNKIALDSDESYIDLILDKP